MYFEPRFQPLKVHDLGQFKKSQQDHLSEKKRSNIGNTVYEIASYNMRRMCVKIKNYSVNKPPEIQIRLFTAKENEDLKQVAYATIV